jgi:predicted glycogen debranching enzyme
MKQTPSPGAELLVHHGDVLSFTLDIPAGKSGRAWLRTNVGRGYVQRRELIDYVESGHPILARNWHDMTMHAVSDSSFAISLPATEIGCFEAKCLFVPDGSDAVLWPEGPNTRIKIEPASSFCGNSVYTAFVRQFGPDLRSAAARPDAEATAAMLDHAGYTVIPPSGTFRGLIRELDFVLGTLRCRVLQLLPIHPVPTTYARMGRFGSPFAGLDFMDVDPSLAEFDRRTTPMDQFRELVHAVHARHARLFLDIPINHTGWASALQVHHPEWFARNEDRSFQSPGAWGVTWEDLARLDYRVTTLWTHMSEVFLFWCRQGVDGFRCDAGYMIPEPVWSYIVAKVREQYPETVFLLEGLGGSVNVMEDLLGRAGMNWAYSELFQNYDRDSVSACEAYAARISSSRGTLVHFAETHDNPRLAAKSQTYSRMRAALSALCSVRGAFGITSGVEWFAAAKVDVHGSPPLNWGAASNQVAEIRRLNSLLAIHPCFHDGARIDLVQQGQSNVVAVRRLAADGTRLLVVANLDDSKPAVAMWQESAFASPGGLLDLLSGQSVVVERMPPSLSCALNPGQVLCLTPQGMDLEQLNAAVGETAAQTPPAATERQRLKAAAVDAWHAVHPNAGMQDVDLDRMADSLHARPEAFLSRIHPRAGMPIFVRWEWPRDLRRTVMVPPGRFLLVKAQHHFSVELRDERSTVRHARALQGSDGIWFAMLTPLPTPDTNSRLTLDIRYFGVEGPTSAQVAVLYLAEGDRTGVSLDISSEAVRSTDPMALCTNGRGAMALVRGAWGEIRSQYDAMLAANFDPEVPVDRHVLLTRCRAWLVNRGYSQEIGAACLDRFSAGAAGGAMWRFVVPAGMGRQVTLDVAFNLVRDRNAATLSFTRAPGGSRDESLNDSIPVTLIVRPDIEDRINHCKTKAYEGPEQKWPKAIAATPDGFVFRPADGRSLRMTALPGGFTGEPQWSYMVGHPQDADRGFDGTSDLFSPGYFSLALRGGETACLSASADDTSAAKGHVPAPKVTPAPNPARLDEVLLSAMRAFLVKRNDGLTVIAGYPWFLDWGRDTLIALRGMISAGFHVESREIVRQFARFEERGTLPNMIRGNDAGNRDTSDAPLWLFVACSDLAQTGAVPDLYRMDCGGRTLSDVLRSIAVNYVGGTENGIGMDESSGLIFSPAHFTWMDTNFPAATPRQGYPIEIQALWHAALQLMTGLDSDHRWPALADKVKASILRHYCPQGQAFLSDCLHADAGMPAASAQADDALRPNQLLAICLGAVDDPAVSAAALSACEELLVPGAIRSLADRSVRHGLPVRLNGRLLNDPHRPYWGQYRGDEDTRRKPAYHNGTAWTWLFPSYAEGLFRVYGERSRRTALALLGSSVELLQRQCLGHLPELTDGDTPHSPRGTPAQAWSVTELYRVLTLLRASD